MGGVQVGRGGGECSVNGGDGERLLSKLPTRNVKSRLGRADETTKRQKY